MAADSPVSHSSDGSNSGDDILRRADALIARHRRTAPDSNASVHADDVPVLTEVVLPGRNLVPVRPAETTESAKLKEAAGPDSQVISRVQSQNMEHAAYLRVMSQVDKRINNVVRDRVMPDMGSALNDALVDL